MHYPVGPNEGFQVAPPAATGAAGPARTFQLREMWAAIYRSRYGIAAIMGACIAAAIIFTLLATRYYSSEALVEVRQEAAKVLGTEADQESDASKFDTDRFLQTQLDIIRSRAVANAVAESLGLYQGDGFLKAMKAREANESTILSPQEAKRERILSVLNDNLSVHYTGDTRIAVITFTSPDPRLSTKVANGFADSFIRSSLARKFDSSSYALDFLRRQLAEAQARLEKSEQAAIDYARRTRIVDASNAAAASPGGQNQPQSLTTAQLVQLNQVYSEAVAERIQAEQKWSRTSGLPLMSIPEVLSNQAIQSMLDHRAQLEGSYREQLATHLETYPGVQAAAARISELDSQINSLARQIRNSIKSQFDVALAREHQVAGKLDSLKNTTLSEQNQTIELSILRREADTNRQQYDALLKRYNSLNAESGVQTNNLTIIDRAEVPQRPTWPKLPLSLAFAFAAGLLLSGIFVVGREQLFDNVRTPDDISNRLHLSILGATPRVNELAESMEDSKSALAEAYNSIRTSLLLTSSEGGMRSIMFTSTQASEGKSSTCNMLARSFARLGKRVLIIDVDLRRPNAHRLFDMDNKVGLTNALSGQVTIEKAIRPTGIKNIDLISAGPIAPNPSELINNLEFEPLMEQFADRYDLLLIDSAPVLGLADAVILANRVDLTVFVIEAGRNTVRSSHQAVSRLGQGGANVVGAILTKFDPGRFGYGYGEGYGYGYSYHYGQSSSNA